MKEQLQRFIVGPSSKSMVPCDAREEVMSMSKDGAILTAKVFNKDLANYTGELEATAAFTASRSPIEFKPLAITITHRKNTRGQLVTIYNVINEQYKILASSKDPDHALDLARKANLNIYKLSKHTIGPALRFVPNEVDPGNFEIFDHLEKKVVLNINVSPQERKTSSEIPKGVVMKCMEFSAGVRSSVLL